MRFQSSSLFANLTVISLYLMMSSYTCHADEYSLAIQPILPEEELKKIYQPLADYLSEKTGHDIYISTHRTFITYWSALRKQKKGFDFALDAAHFTGYRAQKFNYQVLAKLPDTVSFSIVTGEDDFILDVEELMGARIATMPSPSIGALRLEEFFPNPVRIPTYVWLLNADSAIKSVLSGKVDAAIVPTRLVSTADGLNTVVTSESVPHMAFSASPSVPSNVVYSIQQALLSAHLTKKGRGMLSQINFDKFEGSSNEEYIPYADMLKNVFGYGTVYGIK